MANQVILFSTDLMKWNSDKMKVGVSFNLNFNGEAFSQQFDVFIKDKTEAALSSLAEIEKATRERFSLGEKDKLELKNTDLIQASLQQYYERLQRELGSSHRNGKSKHKPSITRYNLFYLKEPEINLLSDNEKYLAYLDIIERKAAKEQFTQIGNYLAEALKIKPEDSKLLKYQARYFMDSNQMEAAAESLNKFHALNPDDEDTIAQLIRLYDESGDYKKAEEWSDKILEKDPQNMDALARKAQYKYFRKQKYTTELDSIRKSDSEWLKNYLRKTWIYRLPKAKMDLNPIRAARYLGYEKALDIVSYAFRNEIPCDSDTKAARVMFSREEIDAWHELINRYDINDHAFDLFPKELSKS